MEKKLSFPSKVGAFLRENASESVFGTAKFIYQFFTRPGKLKGEMDYWRMQAKRSGKGTLSNYHYRPIILAMAKGYDEDFFANKIVADFRCGPQYCHQATRLAMSVEQVHFAVMIGRVRPAPHSRQSANFCQPG